MAKSTPAPDGDKPTGLPEAAAAIAAASAGAPDLGPVTEPVASAPALGRVVADDLGRASVEEPRVERDAAGNPRSATIEARPATPVEELLGRPLPSRATPAAPAYLATTLPATTRVLASGFEVPAKPRLADAGEERVFTAASRILRSKKLYDVGAPVPLTRVEFVSKRQLGAVAERDFEDGVSREGFDGVAQR